MSQLTNPEVPDQLPPIDNIGRLDAGAAASTVFGGVYAPWAGTLLFPYLGHDDFFLEWLLSSTPVSGSSGETYKAQAGTYDLISAIEAGRSAAISAGFSNPGEALFNLVSSYLSGAPMGVPDGDQSSLEQATNDFFADYYRLADNNPYSPGDELVFFEPFTGPSYHVGTLGDDRGETSIQTSSSTDVVHSGEGDDQNYLYGGGDLVDGGEGEDEANYSGYYPSGLKFLWESFAGEVCIPWPRIGRGYQLSESGYSV